jgi:hypothetical protein
MVTGYSFFEAFWKRKRKERFLKEKLNDSEKWVYNLLDNMILVGLIVLPVYILFKIFIDGRFILDNWMILMGFTNFFISIIKQSFRRVKLMKYEYYKRSKNWQNILIFLWIIIIHILTLIGFLVVLNFFSNLLS